MAGTPRPYRVAEVGIGRTHRWYAHTPTTPTATPTKKRWSMIPPLCVMSRTGPAL